MDEHFECFWESLQILARKHGERVTDESAWREDFDAGITAEEAFYAEYPEHRTEVA